MGHARVPASSLALVATRELGPELGKQVLQPVVLPSLELREKSRKLVARVTGEPLDRLLAHTPTSRQPTAEVTAVKVSQGGGVRRPGSAREGQERRSQRTADPPAGLQQASGSDAYPSEVSVRGLQSAFPPTEG